MAKLEILNSLSGHVTLPPTEAIHNAVGSNHDIKTGIDELIDNAIDAGAHKIVLLLHIDGHRLVQIGIHDDGIGMNTAFMKDVLRLGGHQARNDKNIGRYGIGLKEGSFSNANKVTIVSRRRGEHAAGFELQRSTFDAGILDERSAINVWNLRADFVELKHGTSIVWNDLRNVYNGNDAEHGVQFIGDIVEKIRKHVGIRYHRFLADGRVAVAIFTRWDDMDWQPTPEVKAIDPFGYRKTSKSAFPKVLSVSGEKDAPRIEAHVWNNHSKMDEFNLEAKDQLGHQGFYFYDADRLLTHGGWSGFMTLRKELKLLRIVVDDSRIIDKYVTVSPQKGSVHLSEGFHRFVDSLRVVGRPDEGFREVCEQAKMLLRASNAKSSKADPLSQAGNGIASSVKRVVDDEANLRLADPVHVKYKALKDDQFVEIDNTNECIYINKKYRKLINHGHNEWTDAPLVKTLLYLLFNNAASQKRTGKMNANIETWSSILEAAVKEQAKQVGFEI